MSRSAVAAAVLAAAVISLAAAAREERVDLAMVTRIRDEGFNNSKVMDTLAQLTDVLGPRLTGSPQLKQANEWTRQQLASWGLAGARLEGWGPFGRGWTLERVSVHMVSPSQTPLIALPRAWTPGTDGPVRGKALRVNLTSQADLDKQRGKLAERILLLSAARTLRGPDKALFSRYSDEELSELAHFQLPLRLGGPDREERNRFQRKLREFLSAEKALATLEVSERDAGIVRVGGGGSREKAEDPGVPALVMAAEHYNRIVRLLERKTEVELEVDVQARFHDDDLKAYNTLAEIPGTDKKNEVVMVGAHLDSWHGGTGATDNGAGSAVAMEAVRILQALEVKPRRTIRIALWSGEEQGLLGSRAYVREHLASRPPDPRQREGPPQRERGPLTLKPEHATFSVYFNLDNGTGKIRGVYTQQNPAALPVFQAWLEPFADLGATTVTNRNTGGTDHQSFDGVGLPGFQFIQDQADYSTRTHHTNMDVYDRAQKDDLVQASVVVASFLYHAAMREERFPRKPLPKDRPEPSPSPSPEAEEDMFRPSPEASPSPSPSPPPATRGQTH